MTCQAARACHRFNIRQGSSQVRRFTLLGVVLHAAVVAAAALRTPRSRLPPENPAALLVMHVEPLGSSAQTQPSTVASHMADAGSAGKFQRVSQIAFLTPRRAGRSPPPID